MRFSAAKYCYWIVFSAFLFVFVALGEVRAQAVEDKRFLTLDYPYMAASRQLDEVMTEFAQRTMLPVNVSSSLEGVIDVKNSDGTIGTFLNEVASKVGAIWWHDGVVIHLEEASSVSSAYVDISDFPIEELNGQIARVGLGWSEFPIRVSGDGALARIVGPEMYVAQVKEVVERLVELRRNRPERIRSRVQPRLYIGGGTPPADRSRPLEQSIDN